MIKIPELPQFNWKRNFMPFLIGISSFIYVSVFGPVKVVDIVCVVAILKYFPRIFDINKQNFFLILSFLLIFFVSFFDVVGGNNFEFVTLFKNSLSAILALLVFIIVSKMTNQELIHLIYGLLLIAFIQSIFMILIQLKIIPELGMIYHSVMGDAFIGTAPDPSRAGLFFSCAFSFSLSLFYLYKRNIFLVLCFLFFYVVIMSNSRQYFGISIIILFFYLFLYIKNNFKDTSRLVLIFFKFFPLVLIVIISYNILGYDFIKLENLDIYNKFSQKGINYEHTARYFKMIYGLQHAFEYPFGIGIDGYNVLGFGSSHNSYIELLVNGGFLSLFFFIIYFIFVFLYNLYPFLNKIFFYDKNLLLIFFQYNIFFIFLIGMFFTQIHYLLFSYIMFGIITHSVSSDFRASMA